MKTVWGVLMIVAFAAVLFGGVSLVNNEVLINNGNNLNSDSINLIAQYDNNLGNLSNLQNSNQRIDPTLSSNNTNQVDAFFREAAENKNNIEKLRNGIEYVWDLPELILLSLPLINIESNSFLILFKGVFYFMVSVLLLIIFYKALKGKVDGES